MSRSVLGGNPLQGVFHHHMLTFEQCDETKPRCLNCVRYPSDCSYKNSSEESLKTHLAAAPILPKPTPSPPSSGSSEFSLWDFKLLHHWKVSTAESLAGNKNLQLAMRDVLPRLAIDHSCLLLVLPLPFTIFSNFSQSCNNGYHRATSCETASRRKRI